MGGSSLSKKLVIVKPSATQHPGAVWSIIASLSTDTVSGILAGYGKRVVDKTLRGEKLSVWGAGPC